MFAKTSIFGVPRRREFLWLALAVLVFPAAQAAPPAAPTNAPIANSSRVREDLIKTKIRNDMFREWGAQNDSLNSVTPRMSQPGLSPAQARELKAKLDEQRYWMFADPNEAGKGGSGEKDGLAPSVLDGLVSGTPRILQKYFERTSGNRRTETNGVAGDERGYRDPLNPTADSDLLFGAAKGRADKYDRRTEGAGMESAASRAISRLFQPGGGRSLEVPAAAGWFSGAVFAAPAAIPMERTPEMIARMNEFQKLLNGPGAAPPNSYGALPPVAPGGSGLGGGGDLGALRIGSGIPTAGGGSSLLGASSLPVVTAPAAPSIRNFQPPAPPRRRF